MQLENAYPHPPHLRRSEGEGILFDFLGFRLDWEHRFEEGLPLYMQISKDRCILHLSGHHGDCSPGAAMRIETAGLEAFQRELAAKQYRYARPTIEATPWGSHDMSVTDPFGNRLTFTHTGGTQP
jgi:hypothetical protein